jgi:hypothetical protein
MATIWAMRHSLIIPRRSISVPGMAMRRIAPLKAGWKEPV